MADEISVVILTSDVQISRTGKFFGNNARVCNQLLTVAADGMVLFWDLRGSDPKLEVNERERLPFRQLDLNWSPLLRVCFLRSYDFFFFLPLSTFSCFYFFQVFLTMDSMSEIGGTRVSVCIPPQEAQAMGMRDPSKMSTFIFVGSEVTRSDCAGLLCLLSLKSRNHHIPSPPSLALFHPPLCAARAGGVRRLAAPGVGQRQAQRSVFHAISPSLPLLCR